MNNKTTYPYIVGVLVKGVHREFKVINQDDFFHALGIKPQKSLETDLDHYEELLSIKLREDGTEIVEKNRKYFIDKFGLDPVFL
ncbi:MAG: hypothetical protein ACRCZW_11620 [Lactobacillaceae bacterium]